MARRVQRQDTEQDRPRQAISPACGRTLHEPIPLLGAVDGLGHDHVGAGLELSLEPIELVVRVGGRRIERAGDRESGRCADRLAGLVLAAIEARQHSTSPVESMSQIPVPEG